MEVLGQVVQIWINLTQDKWECVFEFCNIAVRFSVYLVWTSVLSFNSLKLLNIKTMKLYLLNNPVLISKLTWLEPTIQAKTSTWSAVNFKKTCDLDELKTWASDMVTWYWSGDTMFWQLSIDHNMDFQYHICTIKPRLHDLALGGVWLPCSTEFASLGACAHNPRH